MTGLAAVALVILAVTFTGREHQESTDVLTDDPTTTAVPGLVALPPPATVFVHRQTGTGKPGEIVEVRTTDGAQLRVLGADYDPYVGNGFHASASALYWSRLDEPRQRFPIKEVRRGDGTARDVADGTLAMPSQDGALLLTRSGAGVTVTDLATGTAVVAPPLPSAPQETRAVVWLSGGHRLLALTGDKADVLMPCSLPGGPIGGKRLPARCTYTTPVPGTTPRSWVLDLDAPTTAWALAGATPGWNDVALLGPGRLPGTVLLYAPPVFKGAPPMPDGQPSAPPPDVVLTVRADGSVVDRVELPGMPMDVDHTGTNLLVRNATGVAWLSLADPTPVHITDDAAQATWW